MELTPVAQLTAKLNLVPQESVLSSISGQTVDKKMLSDINNNSIDLSKIKKYQTFSPVLPKSKVDNQLGSHGSHAFVANKTSTMSNISQLTRKEQRVSPNVA